MRSWLMAAIAALAIGTAVPADLKALPAEGQTTTVGAKVDASVQEARYTTRCHKVRVWRNGHRTWVRRCRRVWVG